MIVADEKGKSDASLIIGSDTALNAIGDEFRYITVGFSRGTLLQPLSNALVYDGDELFIGKRKVARTCGLKLWVLSFGDEELKFVWDEGHSETKPPRGRPVIFLSLPTWKRSRNAGTNVGSKGRATKSLYLSSRYKS